MTNKHILAELQGIWVRVSSDVTQSKEKVKNAKRNGDIATESYWLGIRDSAKWAAKDLGELIAELAKEVSK